MWKCGQLGLLALLVAAYGAPVAAHDQADRARRVHAAASHGVFAVEAGGAFATGFLVDTSGLILSNARVLGSSRYVSVDIDGTSRVAAQVLSGSGFKGIALLRVNQLAVAGIEPLPLAGGGRVKPRTRKGETLVPMSDPVLEDRPELTATALRAWGGLICFDPGIAVESLGGPLLNLRGEVIGIHAISNRRVKRRPASCALPIQFAKKVLRGGRARSAELPPPPAAAITIASHDFYPLDIAREASRAIEDAGVYRMRSGKINLEFMTPPLIHSLHAAHLTPFTPEKGFFRWQRYRGMYEPAVIVQALPDLRWTAGSPWRVAGVGLYSLAYPFLIFGALLAGADRPPPLPRAARAAYRFKRDLSGLTLLRDGVEIPPLEAALNCKPRWITMARRPHQKVRTRKIRGCHGVFKYPPHAFEPGAALHVQMFEGGTPVTNGPTPVDARLVERIWSDFKPYFEALERQQPAK